MSRKRSKGKKQQATKREAVPEEVLAEGSGPVAGETDVSVLAEAAAAALADAPPDAGLTDDAEVSVKPREEAEGGASEPTAPAKGKRAGRGAGARGASRGAGGAGGGARSAGDGGAEGADVNARANATGADEDDARADANAGTDEDYAHVDASTGEDAGSDDAHVDASTGEDAGSDDAHVDASTGDDAGSDDAHVDASASDSDDAHVDASASDSDDAHVDASASDSNDAHVDASASDSDDAHVDASASDSDDAHVDASPVADDEGEAAALPTSAASMDPAALKHLIEALIFASDKPLTIVRLRQLTRVADLKRIEAALAQITEEYKDRGVMLTSVSGGYQFRTHSRYSNWVQQLIAGKPVRLSRAQLETLAIIAYRQPITRPEIDEIRGVDSSGTLRVLIDRSLIRILGKREEVGRPMLYGTTKEFLDFFSLGDLRELPTLREYSELTAESRKVMSDRLGIDPEADLVVENDPADAPIGAAAAADDASTTELDDAEATPVEPDGTAPEMRAAEVADELDATAETDEAEAENTGELHAAAETNGETQPNVEAEMDAAAETDGETPPTVVAEMDAAAETDAEPDADAAMPAEMSAEPQADTEPELHASAETDAEMTGEHSELASENLAGEMDSGAGGVPASAVPDLGDPAAEDVLSADAADTDALADEHDPEDVPAELLASDESVASDDEPEPPAGE